MPKFVRKLGGVSEYRCANGLQILLFPDQSQSTTSVNITYRVGSRHESPGEYGMAHLLEHLMFKGTPQHRDVPGAMRKRGITLNANTGNDRTHYVASFNADPATLQFVLDLEADRMVNSFVAQSDLATEMTVVRNEYENIENDAMTVLYKRVLGTAYDWHNYGHLPIGPKSDIEQAPIRRLQAFYKRFYRPDNATLLIGGHFDPDATLRWIGASFGRLRAPAGGIPHPHTQEPPQDGERSVAVRRVGGRPALLAHYHVPALMHPDSAALLVLSQMLAQRPGGLLHQGLVDTRLAVEVSVSGLGGVDAAGLRVAAALPPDADVPHVEKQLLDLVENRDVRTWGANEWTRARDSVTAYYESLMTHPEAVIQELSDMVPSDWRMLFQLMDDVPKVTLDDLERVRQAYLRPANRTLGRYLPSPAPQRVEMPQAPAPEQRFATLNAPSEGETGERLALSADRLASRTVVTRLPSGIQLTTLQKRTRGHAVHLMMRLRWGSRDETARQRVGPLIGLLAVEGTTSHTQQQLQDRLSALKAQLRLTSGDQGATLVLATDADHLLEALALAADLMRRPSLPQEAFDRWRETAVADLEASRSDLGVLQQMAVREHYNRARGVSAGDPDYLPSVDEQIADVRRTSLDAVRRFHADHWSANLAQVSAVGALPDGLPAAIEGLFGDWKKPAAPRFVRNEPAAMSVPPARFEAVAHDKTGAALFMHQPVSLNSEDADALPLLLAAHVLGSGSTEGGRLPARVREQAGLSYTIGAALHLPRFGRDASLSITGTFAPQNRDQVMALVADELQRMANHGITNDELTQAKQSMLSAFARTWSDDAALADELLRQSEQMEDWRDVARREAALNAVTVEQVHAAWRKHIRSDGFVIATVGDFKP